MTVKNVIPIDIGCRIESFFTDPGTPSIPVLPVVFSLSLDTKLIKRLLRDSDKHNKQAQKKGLTTGDLAMTEDYTLGTFYALNKDGTSIAYDKVITSFKYTIDLKEISFIRNLVWWDWTFKNEIFYVVSQPVSTEMLNQYLKILNTPTEQLPLYVHQEDANIQRYINQKLKQG